MAENTMSLKGKLIGEITIKSDGDVFHELFRSKPHHISTISPEKIQGCHIHEGEFGTVGSVIVWNYTHDGKPRVAKELIESIDEAKKSVSFKFIEGDLMEIYKNLTVSVHVDTSGEDNLVTWTMVFEKKNEGTPYPFKLMELAVDLTKDIEAHHLKK